MNEKDENELKSNEERFKILDFDGKPMPKKEEVPPVKPGPEPLITHQKIAPLFQGPETVTDDVPRQITSIEELDPELKSSMKEVFKAIPKEDVKQLLNEIQTQKEILFDKENKSAFGKLNDKDQSILIEKMAEWHVPEELSHLNASVILSWLNNTIKEGKK